jgi:hypothetical protein
VTHNPHELRYRWTGFGKPVLNMNANKDIEADMALDADEEEKNLHSYSLQNIREEIKPYLQLLTHKRS